MVDGIGSAGIAVELFDFELIGLNAENSRKLLFTLALVVFVYSLRWLGLLLVRRFVTRRPNRSGFWTDKAYSWPRSGCSLLASSRSG